MVSCRSVDGQLFAGWSVVQWMVSYLMDSQLSFSVWSVVQWTVGCRSANGQLTVSG